MFVDKILEPILCSQLQRSRLYTGLIIGEQLLKYQIFFSKLLSFVLGNFAVIREISEIVDFLSLKPCCFIIKNYFVLHCNRTIIVRRHA